MNLKMQNALAATRRHFLSGCGVGLANLFLAEAQEASLKPKKPDHAPKAKSVIFLQGRG